MNSLIIKAVVYRILASIALFFIAFIIGNKFNLALSVAVVDFLLKLLFYFLFELGWIELKKRFKI